MTAVDHSVDAIMGAAMLDVYMTALPQTSSPTAHVEHVKDRPPAAEVHLISVDYKKTLPPSNMRLRKL